MSFDEIRMGVKRPESLDKQLAIQEDVRAMRKAITFAQRDSALVNRCLRMAEHYGLSSEETMVLVAYHSLCMLQDVYEQNLKLTMLDIRAPFVPGSSDQP